MRLALAHRRAGRPRRPRREPIPCVPDTRIEKPGRLPGRGHRHPRPANTCDPPQNKRLVDASYRQSGTRNVLPPLAVRGRGAGPGREAGRNSRRMPQACGQVPARNRAAPIRAYGWLRRPPAGAVAQRVPAAPRGGSRRPASIEVRCRGQWCRPASRCGPRNGVTVLSKASFTMVSRSSCLSPKCL